MDAKRQELTFQHGEATRFACELRTALADVIQKLTDTTGPTDEVVAASEAVLTLAARLRAAVLREKDLQVAIDAPPQVVSAGGSLQQVRTVSQDDLQRAVLSVLASLGIK
jgi:hypothetical protein